MGDVLTDGQVTCRACGEDNPPTAKFCGSCGTPCSTGGPPRVGEVVADRYRIVRLLGRGGMGVVYKVEHVQIGKPMAMKLLHRNLERDTDTLRRFQREAESASKLSHPNTVQVFDFGRSQSGWMYLVMEYIDGPHFGELVENEGPLPFGRVAYLMAQVASSVVDAHAAGIVHRDLKPENIMITEGPDGEMAKVLDFGLAKLLEDSDSKVTRTGTIIGTPYYMSPEQIRGDGLDGRSDIYSLGAVMYEALVGAPPFEAASPVGVLSKHLTERLTPPSERASRSTPPEADRIVVRAMQKDPEDRYQTAEELRADLIEYLTSVDVGDWRISAGHPASRSGTRSVPPAATAKRPRWFRWALGGAALLLGLAIWGIATRGPTEREPNHELSKANPILEGEVLEGYLGRRLDLSLGDQDVFRIRNESAEPSMARIELSGLPNMNLLLELLDPESGEPVLVADTGGVGKGEVLPNVPLAPGSNFVRVREDMSARTMPTENVSDAYEIKWNTIDLETTQETEYNDSLETAEQLPLGQLRRACLGWHGDVDAFCLSEGADRVVAQVSALEGVDLVLRLVNRRTERSAKRNARGVGGAETSKPWRNVQAGDFCVEVTANESTRGAAASAPHLEYGVQFVPVRR